MNSQILKERASYHVLASTLFPDFAHLRRLLAKHRSWSVVKEKLFPKISEKKMWADLEDKNIKLVLSGEPNFPKLLRPISDSPLGLYYRGSLESLDRECVAVVGTRKASDFSKTVARDLSRTLVSREVTIVSGLAFGIDAAAHTGALSAGGLTAAVLATGVDKFSPTANANLAKQIIDSGGVVLSEYPPNSRTLPAFFLARNRIVAGLCSVTVVIEAPIKSGALSTARFARKFNRRVFAVPGAINVVNYAGSNDLIKCGHARLLTSANDIFASESKRSGSNQKGLKILSTLDKNCKIILTVLISSGASLHPDKIAQLAGLDLKTVQESLAELFISGRVIEDVSGYYRVA